MVQTTLLGSEEYSRRVKCPAGEKRVHGGVRAQLEHGSTTHRRGHSDQVAEADGEFGALHISTGRSPTLDRRRRREARAVRHRRLLPEYYRGKKFIVACRVLEVGWGGGSTTGSAALSGKWRANDLGGSVPEQEEIYEANGLDLREARHKHGCGKVAGKKLECCGNWT